MEILKAPTCKQPRGTDLEAGWRGERDPWVRPDPLYYSEGPWPFFSITICYFGPESSPSQVDRGTESRPTVPLLFLGAKT